MAVRADLDLYNVLLGFGRLRERVELVRATLDPDFLFRARRALGGIAMTLIWFVIWLIANNSRP